MDKKLKILYMDDEESIRKLFEKIMNILGNEIVLSTDGMDAFQKYSKSMKEGRKFDCVILDLTVNNGMNGSEAGMRILEADPSAKIIISSGYTNDNYMVNFADYGFKGSLIKPFRIEKLREILDKVISEN